MGFGKLYRKFCKNGEWIVDYVHSRYGTTNTKLQQAWQLLLQTAYSSPDVYQEGPSESIFCARPSLEVKSVSSWGTRKRNYDTALFEEAIRLFVEAGHELNPSETYLADRIDFVRQMQANRADAVYAQMVQAVNDLDKRGFSEAYSQFETMLLQQDSLLSSSPYFSHSTWLIQAQKMAMDDTEKTLNLLNAKTQISYWGPNNRETNLHDYAHKEWGGMLRTLYLSRWGLFAKAMQARLNGETIEENYFEMEKEWAESAIVPPSFPMTEQQQTELINRIIAQ